MFFFFIKVCTYVGEVLIYDLYIFDQNKAVGQKI